jgi:hypothetical protein
MRWRKKFAFLSLIICFACAGSFNEREPADGLRVLFIGNSLTYANDLPSIVEAMAEATNQKRFVHKAVVFADYGLEDHWERGDARRALSDKKWDVVVLQQGPSASTEGRASLIEYSRRFAELIRRAGAKPALYMVWPSTSRAGDFDGVSESYRRAAQEINGMLFPAGEAWRAAWRRDATLALYSPDGLHPTLAGSYLAALVIYEQLYGQTPGKMPARLRLRSSVIELPEKQAEVIQAAAAEANQKFALR